MTDPSDSSRVGDATCNPPRQKTRFSLRRFDLLCAGLVVLLVALLFSWRWIVVSWQIHLARQTFLESEPEIALKILERAEKLQPDRAELMYLLARAHRRSGDLAKTSKYLGRASALGWPAEELNQQRYLIDLQSGRFDQVEPYFKRLLEGGASDELAVEFYEAQAKGLLQSYRFKEAMVCLNYWIDWRPKMVRPRLWRGEIWERILYYSNAISEYTRVLEVAPDHVEARRRLARNLLVANKATQALNEYAQCLKDDPQDIEARIGAAKCHQQLAHLAEAEKRLREILKSKLTDEQKASVVTDLATIVLERKQPGEAILLLTEAIELVRANPDAHYVLSRAYSQAGNADLAAAHAAESKRIHARYARLAEIIVELLEEPENADLRYEAGRILMEQGLLREGAAWMATALQDNPLHQEAQHALAKYYSAVANSQLAKDPRSLAEPDRTFAPALAAMNSKDIPRIREQLEVLERDSTSPALRHLLKASLHLQEGDPTAALRELRLVPAESAKVLRVPALSMSGQAMSQLGHQKDAERLWLEAVSQDPNAEEPHRCLAMLYYDWGAMDNAQKHALRVGELAPQDPRPHRLLGLMRKDSEHYEDAVKYYLEALRRNPAPPALHEIRLELAESQMKMGQHSAALETLRDCPRSVNRIVLEAECHFSTNRREQAESLLQEALRLSPDDFSALLLQGTIALERANLPAAVAALSRAVAVRPRDYQANLQLMRACRRAGKQEQADALSQLVEELRKLRLEFSELHERATAEPANVEIRFRLGQIAQQLDQPELAQLWFRAAMAMDPRRDDAHPEVKSHQGR